MQTNTTILNLKVQLDPNYDDALFLINVRPLTQSQCFSACINNTNCVSYVHLPNTQECYLKEKRDILNGYLRDSTYSLVSLQSMLKKFRKKKYFIL